MRKEWKLLEVAGKPGKHARYKLPEERWTYRELLRQSPDSPLQPYDPCRQWVEPKKRAYLQELISAQLILYRLVSVFDLFPTAAGMGRESVKSNKSCWGLTLVRRGDERSQIRFQDHRGAAGVQFEGTKESGVLALELVNFIISNNVPLAEGTLAGTVSNY